MRTVLCILIALYSAAPAAAQDKSATVKWLERAQRAGMIDEAQVEDVRLEELLQKQKHHELISELEPRLERGEVLPAARLMAEIERTPTSASVLGPQKFQSIARIRMAQRRFDKALAAVQDPAAKTLSVLKMFYDETFQEIPKYFILTKSLYETGNLKDAKAGYDQLLKHPQIAQIGGIHWPVLLDRARIARSEGEQAVYQELVPLLVDGGQAAEAFRYAERAKGRALVDPLASQQNIVTHAADGAGAKDTADRLAIAERELNVVADPANAGAGTGTRRLVVALKQQLFGQDPDFASLVSVASTDLRDLEQRLDADETLLEYYATGRDWYLFTVSREGVSAQKLALPDLENDVLAFREALSSPGSADYRTLSARLHASLVAPVAERIAAGRLTIVPHGVLHYLPFAALSTGGEYLVDRHRLLILGNPDLGDPQYDLKFAEDEALRQAQLTVKKTYPHPYYWAAFQLTGRAR